MTPPPPISRRKFVAGSVKVALGAAAAGASGVTLDLVDALANADAATHPRTSAALSRGEPVGLTSPPPAPPGAWSFVSRPDLTPPGVTIATSSGFKRSSAPGYIFVAPRVSPSGTMPQGSQRGLMILDVDGNMVWFKPQTAAGDDPFNFQLQRYNGKPVLTWFQGTVGPGYGIGGEGVLMDSSYSQVTTVTSQTYPMDLHEFLLTPEGTALMTAYEKSGSLVIGHAQEIDIATGDLVFDWACYPAVSTSESYTSTTGDYFHINSIDLWPGSERDLLISSRDCSAMYLVERSTKNILWRLHGKKSNFRTNQSSQFWFQHDARALKDGSGVSVFDDASQPSPEKQSWAKVITLDMTEKTAVLRHQYPHVTAKLDTGSQGNCQLLSNGGHFVGWGANPYFSEFAPSGSVVEGSLVLDGRLPNGVESYRAFSFDWVGSPAVSELALAVLPGAGSGHFVAFASWNGATNVASWQIDVATATGGLASYAVTPKDGFETSIPITYTGAHTFQALALDSEGQVIGRSAVVTSAA